MDTMQEQWLALGMLVDYLTERSRIMAIQDILWKKFGAALTMIALEGTLDYGGIIKTKPDPTDSLFPFDHD